MSTDGPRRGGAVRPTSLAGPSETPQCTSTTPPSYNRIPVLAGLFQNFNTATVDKYFAVSFQKS